MKKIVMKVYSKHLRFMHTVVGFMFYLLPQIAKADGDTPVGEGLHYLINAMYGSTGVAIATLSIMTVGLLCLFHVIRWAALLYTVAGISIIFGAPGIVSGITRLVHTM